MQNEIDPEMEKFREFNRFEKSIKTGRLTEDLLSEVKSLFGEMPESPDLKPRKENVAGKHDVLVQTRGT